MKKLSFILLLIGAGASARPLPPYPAVIKTFLGLGGDFTFRLTVTDGNGKTGHKDIVVTKPGLPYTTYNAANNATFTNGATFTGVVSDGSTPVVFNVSGASSSNGFGYFGVIDIKRTE